MPQLPPNQVPRDRPPHIPLSEMLTSGPQTSGGRAIVEAAKIKLAQWTVTSKRG